MREIEIYDLRSTVWPKLIVWDFDLTLLSIHSWGAGIRAEYVASRTLSDDVADIDFFRHFVDRAQEQGIAVAIASFGQYEVIQAYMDRIIGRGVFNRENISTQSLFGTNDGCIMRGGKVPMLRVRKTLIPKRLLFTAVAH